jgi:hypothetical protein
MNEIVEEIGHWLHGMIDSYDFSMNMDFMTVVLISLAIQVFLQMNKTRGTSPNCHSSLLSSLFPLLPISLVSSSSFAHN